MSSVRLHSAGGGYVEMTAPPGLATAKTWTVPEDGIELPGLKLLTVANFSAQASVSVNNCFSSTYDNYRIMWRYLPSTTTYALFRLRAGGTDASGASDYIWQYTSGNGASTASGWSGGTSSWQIGPNKQYISYGAQDIFAPAKAEETQLLGSAYSRAGELQNWAGHHLLSAAYDGFTLLLGAAATISGSISVYGYRKA